MESLSLGWNSVSKEPLHGSVPSFLSHIREFCQGTKCMPLEYHKTCYILSLVYKGEAVHAITNTATPSVYRGTS